MFKRPQAALTGLLLATYFVGLPPATASTVFDEPALLAQATTPTIPPEVARLNGTSWQLEYWEGSGAPSRIISDTNITLEFAGNVMTGSSSCNRYQTSYQVNGSNLSVAEPGLTTQLSCSSGVRRQESLYLQALDNVQSYRFSGANEIELIYRTRWGNGVLVFRQSDRQLTLDGTAWTLNQWSGANAPARLLANTPITVEFTRDGISGLASCNRYRSTYSTTGANLSIAAIALTRISCAADVLQQEAAFVSVLERAQSYRINEQGQLQIAYGSGQSAGTLTFNLGQTGATRPDPERTLYVAPQTVPCFGGTTQQCLQIRETPTGTWAVLYGGIEGFNYQPGFNYQLRVAERPIANPPPGTPTSRLVLLEVVSQTRADSGTGNPPPTGNRQGTLTASDPEAFINIRSRPSTQSDVVSFGRVGDQVVVLRESRGSDGFTWYNVRLGQPAVEGWVREDLIRISTQSSGQPPTSGDIQQLPTVQGVNLSQVRYVRATLTPIPALEQAILQQLPGYRYRAGDPTTQAIRYLYNQVDLNDDGVAEVLVYLSGTPTCNTAGCSLLIFQPSGNGYRLVSRLEAIRNPVIVTDQRTRGWNDLVVYVDDGVGQGAYRRLPFDGRGYPSNPFIQPVITGNTVVTGQAVISDRITSTTNAPLLITSR